jgi:hypothetical protein
MRLTCLLAALLGLAGAATTAHAEPPIHALDWLAQGADPVAAVTRAPPECLALPADKAAARQVEAGRLLFRSPLLLGGQAARHGLTCQTCHVNGHDNPHFFIEGISGAPGTVDVTSSIFSEVRGDGQFNPVPIPSLVDAGSRTTFGHEGKVRSLPQFVKSVIMDEFAGAEPAGPAFDAVIAYIEALKSDACPVEASVPITLATYEEDIERGFGALRDAVARGDGQTADALILALQSRLGEVFERYRGAGLEMSAGRLADTGRRLGALRTAVAARSEAARWQMTVWYQAWSDLKPQLKAEEEKSLFNPRVLRAVLKEGEAQ